MAKNYNELKVDTGLPLVRRSHCDNRQTHNEDNATNQEMLYREGPDSIDKKLGGTPSRHKSNLSPHLHRVQVPLSTNSMDNSAMVAKGSALRTEEVSLNKTKF